MEDCSKGGNRPPETHDHRQWTAEYVGSLAAWMTTTGDGGGWNQRQAGCGRKDTVAPDRSAIGIDEHSQLEVDAFRRPQPCGFMINYFDHLLLGRIAVHSGLLLLTE